MELEHIYAKKVALIMDEYIKGEIDALDYLEKLEDLEEWYEESSNATVSE